MRVESLSLTHQVTDVCLDTTVELLSTSLSLTEFPFKTTTQALDGKRKP